MERDGDLLLNVSCSANQVKKVSKLPKRMPDGTKIEASRSLTKKISKTHTPASSSGNVFIPRHKLPVLDEFGLTTPKDHIGFVKPPRMLPSLAERETGVRKPPPQVQLEPESEPTKLANKEPQIDSASRKEKRKRKKRKEREDEPQIIPKEVRAVAGGLPPSFPQHRIKKFTEEYQERRRKKLENGEDLEEPERKKRRSFVPGLNPRKKEKAAHVFSDSSLDDLEDLHPYLKSNLEQNFSIKKLTKIQALVMPKLLKTRWDDSTEKQFIINSGVGSGKILSYVVPIINNLALIEPRIDRTAGIYALVLLPTRELAAEVSNIFVNLCRSFLWVVPGLLTGGERKKSEKARLRKGLNILITTPGRLIDHMEHSKSMEFSKMKYFVMADAHRLLDPERAEVAKRISILLRKQLPRKCVRCIVTATMTKKLEKFCEILVDKPQVIDAFKQFE